MQYAYKIVLLVAVIPALAGCGMDSFALADRDPNGYLETDSEVETTYEFDQNDTDITAERSNLLAGANGDTDPVSCNTADSSFADLYHDDPNATAGPVLARGSIHKGVKPPIKVLRTYEFLNYYDIEYPEAPPSELRIEADLSQIGDSERFTFQFGISSEALDTFHRRPVNLVLSVDNSASMAGDGMEIVLESCASIAGSLAPGDTISVTTWNPAGSVLLSAHRVNGVDDPAVIEACQALRASGGSDFQLGLATAYAQAALDASDSASNRVILLSDGVTSVSLMDRALVDEAAAGNHGPPIRLIGAGVGSPVNFSDLAMYTLAEAGKGPYLFIDSGDEAAWQFGERFASLVDIAADEIAVSVQLPPTFRMVAAYGNDAPASLSNTGGQEIAPGTTMVFHQQLESCELESVSLSDRVEIYVTWRQAESTAVESIEFSATLADLLASHSRPLIKGRAIVTYAEALKQIAQSISSVEASAIAADALDELDEARSALGGNDELDEVSELLSAFLP